MKRYLRAADEAEKSPQEGKRRAVGRSEGGNKEERKRHLRAVEEAEKRCP